MKNGDIVQIKYMSTGYDGRIGIFIKYHSIVHGVWPMILIGNKIVYFLECQLVKIN